MVENYINDKQRELLKENFIYFKDASIENLLELGDEKNKYFFDTENAPIFPEDITEKYNLKEVEYNTLPAFKVNTDGSGLLQDLLKESKIKTKIYIWMFGANNSNKVFWGNTIDEFINFVELINLTKINHGTKKAKIKEFNIYVHNLQYDLEFILYYLKDHEYKQYKVTGDYKKDKTSNKDKEYSFDVTQANGTVYNATLQYKHINKVVPKKRKRYNQKSDVDEYNFITTLVFKDSLKITPTSLKDISKKFINIEDIYKKDGDLYKYNLVRDSENYKPTLYESWYQYCDIYILKEWYNQFVIPNYIDKGIKEPNTISQIAFDLILKESFKDIDRSQYIGAIHNGHMIERLDQVTDRVIYEVHFALEYISMRPWIEEILWHSYKGGHCTASRLYAEKSEINETIKGVSIDITSSYPSQCVYKALPYGIPEYYEGKPLKGIIDKEDNKEYDYHFVTIAFDGWTPKENNFNNQFGLNQKLHLNNEEKKTFKLPANESCITNFDPITGEIVGGYRIEVQENKRKKLIKKYKNNFVITVTYNEYLQWVKDYDFWSETEKGYQKGVLFIDTLSFKSEVGFFAPGIMYYFNEKDQAEKDNNEPLKQNAKVIINSFYGKHCSRRDREQRFYNFDKDKDIIKFHPRNEEEFKNVWLTNRLYAVQYGSAVTSYGRIQLRETARILGNDKFIYCDTDSLKMSYDVETLKNKIELHNETAPEGKKLIVSFSKDTKKLGAWDFEYSFKDFKVVGQKKYMYKSVDSDKFICKCAGLPPNVRKEIQRKDDFSIGKTFIKGQKTKVNGGYLILDGIYSLNDLVFNS